MHYSRLVGGLAALAVLLILLAAPVANALPLSVVWAAEYRASTNDVFNAVATAPGGVVYAAGYARANPSGRSGLMLLVKYADGGSSSTREWVRTLQLNGGEANEVAVDSHGNVIVAATSNRSTIGHSGIIVLKYTSAGVLKWSAFYDGPVHREDYVNDLALDARGNALVVGASVGKGTGRDYITLKVRADGTRAWARRYAGPEVFDEARGVAVDAQNNVYVTGWSNDKDRTRRAHTICYSPGGARTLERPRRHAEELERSRRRHGEQRIRCARRRHHRLPGGPRRAASCSCSPSTRPRTARSSGRRSCPTAPRRLSLMPAPSTARAHPLRQE